MLVEITREQNDMITNALVSKAESILACIDKKVNNVKYEAKESIDMIESLLDKLHSTASGE